VDAQVTIQEDTSGYTPGEAIYASLFAVLSRLPHLRLLELLADQAGTAAIAVALPTLDALRALAAPRLTDLRVDVRLVPVQVHLLLTLT